MDIFRTSIARLLESRRGERFAPVRVSRDLAQRLNRTLGEPACNADELERRRQAAARLEALKGAPAPAPEAAPQAPVVIYYERDRNARELARMEDLLRAKGITYSLLDVFGDAAAQAFAQREARVKADDLPVVFVGPTAVGPYPALVTFDVSGKLAKALRGG